MEEIKHKDFIDTAPIIPSVWIMAWWSMEKGEPRFPWVHSLCAMIGSLARIQDRQSLYWLKKLLTIPRVITKWYPLLIIIMLFLLTGSPQKLKLENVHGALIILFYVSPSSPSLQSRFKANVKILSKSSTTQENITISRQNFLFFLKTHKKPHSSASDWWENTKSSFKENARAFSKNSDTQENIRISRLKKNIKTYAKKKTSNQKSNRWLTTWKMNFIN